jgi:hypothetical protein
MKSVVDQYYFFTLLSHFLFAFFEKEKPKKGAKNMKIGNSNTEQ